MNYLVAAIKKLKPEAEFSFTSNDYSTIKWDVLDGEAPTKAELDIAIKEVKAEEIAEAKAKETQRQSVLDRLGITAEEAAVILS
jgi:hypothetical protein